MLTLPHKEATQLHGGRLVYAEGVSCPGQDHHFGLQGLAITQPIVVSILPKDPSARLVFTGDKWNPKSHTSHAKTGEAANQIARGAFVNVKYQATDRSRRSRSLSITDMTTLGASYSDKLLSEVAETGGQRALQGGRIQRRVTEEGARWIVTEFQDSPDPNHHYAHHEVLLGKRYKLVAQATGLSLAELRHWVGKLDLVGLEARAKENRPIE